MAKYVNYPASTRGTADYGWLKANYSFSFAQWYDPNRVHFGALRVLNDDFIAAGMGFGTHPHDNMEIVTIPLSGALEHRDSTGGHGIIHTNDVQIMSAGTGIEHSEKNASSSEPVTLFQCWVFPKKENIQPRYDQQTFLPADRVNRWQTVVSPENEKEGGLWINQDARFVLSDMKEGFATSYTLRGQNTGVYVMVISGEVEVDGKVLARRDALGISDTQTVNFLAKKDTELLLIEIPM
jgi:quercetin 2,3-dioxygenase